MAINLLDPKIGIQSILDAQQDRLRMPTPKQMTATSLQEASLDDLYLPTTVQKLINASLRPHIEDESLLRPEVFSRNLNDSLDLLSSSKDKDIRNFVRQDLRPLIENQDLLKSYVGLLISG